MRNKMNILKKIILSAGLTLSIYSLPAHSLEQSVNSEDRSQDNIARDVYRHPYETLSFFGIKPRMTVVELSPGGGWYTEILSIYMYDEGRLITAAYDPSKGSYYKRSTDNFIKKLKSNEIYEKVEVVYLGSKISQDGEVDAVLTFRNLHNWLGPEIETIFNQTFAALKPGGIFGVVEHRAKPGTSMDEMKKSGYVTENFAIDLARKVGFTLFAKSEINANPKDTKDHPKGVWTLPPSLGLKDKDKEKYSNIGESDRMTLLFKKPL